MRIFGFKQVAALFLIASTAALFAAPARPVKLTPAAAAAAAKEIEQDRVDTRKWLQSDPTSYLATVDRQDFGAKTTLTVGRAADNDVRIDDAAIAAHHLRVTVNGDRFRVQAVDPAAHFTIVSSASTPGGSAKTPEDKREATVDPSSIQVARFVLRLSHQRFPAIIVFDPQSRGSSSTRASTISRSIFPIATSCR